MPDLPDDITPAMAKRLADEYKAGLAVMHYKPSPTQQRFHESMAHDRLLTAGGRGGKTTAALWDLATVALGCNPHKPWYGPVVIIVLCISRQNAHAVVQRKLLEACELPGPIGNQPFIPADEIDHDESASIKAPYRTFYHIKLRNGSMIHFGWSGDQNSWKKLQGIKADYVYIDENAGNDKLVIELMKRLLDVQSDPTKQPWGGCLVWGATGTIVNQTFELFRKRCLTGDNDSAAFVIPAGETGAISSAVHARFAKKLTKEERKIHIDGTETASSLIYIYGKQWDDRRHLLAQDAVPEDSDNVIIGYDPGVDHPTGILICLIKKNRPSQLVCAKFFNHRLMPVEYDIECIHSYLKGRKVGLFIYDYRAKERHKHAAPLIHAISSRMESRGYVPIQGYAMSDKRHEVGIETVRSYLDPNHYDKAVEPLLVLSPSDESGGMLMRSQLMSYRGKEETNFTGAGGVVKKDDEFCDCVRYVCRMVPSWSAALQCGPATFEAPNPMEVPPNRVGAPVVLMSAAEARMQKSRLVGHRNAASVAREFSFIRRNRTLAEVN